MSHNAQMKDTSLSIPPAPPTMMVRWSTTLLAQWPVVRDTTTHITTAYHKVSAVMGVGLSSQACRHGWSPWPPRSMPLWLGTRCALQMTQQWPTLQGRQRVSVVDQQSSGWAGASVVSAQESVWDWPLMSIASMPAHAASLVWVVHLPPTMGTAQ